MRCALALGLCFGLALATVHADSYDERRVRTAARLMRALLSADAGIVDKAGADGWLEVLVLGDAPLRVDGLPELIAPPDDENTPAAVKGLPLRVREVRRVPDQSGTEPDEARPVAVFLAAPLSDAEFQRLLEWCIRERVILYSPFEGDVERGATAGLSVQAKVQPYLNRQTLSSSQIELQAFFVEHSRTLP